MEIIESENVNQVDLAPLTERLSLLAVRIEDMIACSIDALVKRDKELAHKTIGSDRRIDADEVEIRELCIEMLQKHELSEADLRFIIILMKVVTHLERIGNLAGSNCERALELAYIPPLKPYVDIPKMSKLTREMIKDVIAAFIARDEEMAREIIARDDPVDHLYHEVMRELIEIMRNKGEAVDPAIRIMSVAKNLERIGDHVCEIAEQVMHLRKREEAVS